MVKKSNEIKPVRRTVADKGYDAEWLHEYCYDNNIEAHIPMRNYGRKIRHYRLSYRRKAAKLFRIRTYHRREIIEAGIHSTKSKFGFSVNSKTAKTINSEVCGRLVCHNLFGVLLRLRTEPTK